MAIVCKCGGEKLKLVQRQNSTQIGLYCSECGNWIKWIGKKELMKLRMNGVEFITL